MPGEYPLAEPFAGGLESHLHGLVRQLADRGHSVLVVSAGEVDPALDVSVLRLGRGGEEPWSWNREVHDLRTFMTDLAAGFHGTFDVIHNGSLTPVPLEFSALLDVPMITALHTPPTDRMRSALALANSRAVTVAVSRFTAARWSDAPRCRVIANGVDTNQWVTGSGGGGAIWFGRLVPKKGAHHAIAAARLAEVPLVLAGPVHDRTWFEETIRPQLSDQITYAGHLDHQGLVSAVGSSAVSLVTPLWDEPYGLVAAESLSCGTPVAAYDSGALSEFVTPQVGALARLGDVEALASALDLALGRSRAECRRHALRVCSSSRMVDEYEVLYDSLQPAAS